MNFMRQEMILCLQQVEQSERLKELTTKIHGFWSNALREFAQGHKNPGNLREILNYIITIHGLLSENDRKKFIDDNKYSMFHDLMISILDANQLSETERAELTVLLCTFLKENMVAEDLKKYCEEKTIGNKTYLDYAKDSGNHDVIAQLYELTKGKKCDRHIFRIILDDLFHPAEKKPQQENLIAKVLHINKVSEEKNQIIAKGRAILDEVIKSKHDLKLSETENTQPELTLFQKALYSLMGVEEGNKDLYTIRCLSFETGLYALGSGLLTYEDAIQYAKKETLEYFLANPELPYLRLLRPDELAKLKQYQLWEITGDYAYIALEEKLITSEQLSRVTSDEKYSLGAIFTYYGIIALREKLISFEEALTLGTKVICAAVLEKLFTPEGIMALREGLYTKEQILAVDDQIKLGNMLKPDVLAQRRKEMSYARILCTGVN